MTLDRILAGPVAIQGEPGSNSHVAAQRAFPGLQPSHLLSCSNSALLFERLAEGTAHSAVLPIENTLYGSVFEHYDLLLQHLVVAVGEVLLPVRHTLIVPSGVPLGAVRRVLSHPVALAQCRRWFREHPGVEAVAAYDTAGAVKTIMQGAYGDAAALAPVLAAELYGAQVLEHAVEDHHENYTRFYVLERAAAGPQRWPADSDKASLAFGLEHHPGTLMAALGVLERLRLNLTRIESRPVPGRPWEYIFFADVRYPSAEALEEALVGLAGVSTSLRVLGRYRAGEL